jgi:ribosome-binding protein aMBF1 (putative translation factor)
MSAIVAKSRPDSHRVISEIRPEMVKADLRKAENRDFRAEVGACLFRARTLLGWTLEQLASALDRDARQVRRWESGEERVQVDVVMAHDELREPFGFFLAKLSGADVRVSVDFRKVG